MEVAVLALAGSATALATGLGAVPVFLLGPRAVRLRPFLWGTAVGLMGVASIVGLLLPALDEGGRSSVAAGLAAGVLFLLASRRLLAGRDVHVGALSGAGVRRSLLVFGVLLVHSLPEGFAIGTAFASSTEGLALFVVLAIGLQNVPEGTSVAIPMQSAGFGRGAAVLGRRLDQRTAAGRRGRGLPGRGADRWAAAVLLRLRRRSDALARRDRVGASGVRPRRARGRHGGHPRRRRCDDAAGAHAGCRLSRVALTVRS